MKYCTGCGAENRDDAVICEKCGKSFDTSVGTQPVSAEAKNNPMGIAGFVLSLVGLVLCWTGYGGFIFFLLGLIFSAIGISHGKRDGQKIGLAIAGLIISLIVFVLSIILLVVLGAIIAEILGSATALALL